MWMTCPAKIRFQKETNHLWNPEQRKKSDKRQGFNDTHPPPKPKQTIVCWTMSTYLTHRVLALTQPYFLMFMTVWTAALAGTSSRRWTSNDRESLMKFNRRRKLDNTPSELPSLYFISCQMHRWCSGRGVMCLILVFSLLSRSEGYW